MQDMVIWGAGRIGVCAWAYYRSNNNITYFVDSNPQKWGTFIEDIEVCSPDILKEKNYLIVIASKFNVEQIVSELKKKYGITRYIIFNVDCMMQENGVEEEIDYKGISLRFSGGLGNQMFQYALYKCFEQEKKKIYFRNVSETSNVNITDVFESIHLNKITQKEEDAIVAKYLVKNRPNSFFAIYKENMSQGTIKQADNSVLGIDCGIVQGGFQTSFFAEMVKDELYHDYTFKDLKSQKAIEVLQEIRNCDSVSIHVRGGDYLEKRNNASYGGICTEMYYSKAMEYIRARYDGSVFFVFSNDQSYARKMIDGKNVRFVDCQSCEAYEDWNDMFLMSQCKHNIIANSTFSWWGAWLNKNKEKIVVAPSRWINTLNYKDIYPEDWIVMEV